MFYLISEIFVYLLIAMVLGLILGWAINHISSERKVKKLEKIWKINCISLEEELKETQTALQYAQSGHIAPVKDKVQNTQDNLQKISGIGPVLEKRLNRYGIHTFKQIAELSKEDLEWLSETIGAFPDRIERDKWIEQARQMASN